MAAGLAHEINTPMQCVFGNVEFLQKSFVKLTAISDRLVSMLEKSQIDWSEERLALKELRDRFRYDFLRQQTPSALEEAVEGSRRVISIIRAMKVMSHPGNQDHIDTDIHELLQSAAIITRNKWKFVANLNFDFADDLPKLQAYPAELSQVFMNMIVNSTDAIAEKIGPDPSELGDISIATSFEANNLIVKISDTGNGIENNIKHNIFDPFFTTKGVGKGTGQGLAIAYAIIVGKHKGTIVVESERGVGTTFTITLPTKTNHKVTRPSMFPEQAFLPALTVPSSTVIT